MSLTTRLSAYFLAALALVLLGFSGVLYLLVRHHLAHQTHQRLEAALQTLVAAVEVHADDVEWEPLERHITLGEDSGEDQVRWMLHDEAGHLVDCSRNMESAQHALAAFDDRSQAEWYVAGRCLRAGNFDPETMAAMNEGIATRQWPGLVSLPTDRTYRSRALTFRAALSRQPAAAALRQLAWALATIALSLWTVGLLLSRCVCRRALRPVVRMAASARSLRPEHAGQCLVVARTGDELEDLGQAFNEVLSRLSEVLERQQRFTGDASHQLRTPLTVVLGQVEVALRQERSPAEYQRVLEVVRRRAGEMREMVELLLFLARMPARSELPEMLRVNLAEWLGQRLRPWAAHPRFSDLHWHRPADDEGWEVRTQPALLGQVLENLLDNACKYSEPGTPITIELEQTESAVVLAVSDRGHGIHAEDVTHICDPFFRSIEARRLGRSGVGLGLTVAGRILKALGGELRVTSQPGQGSRFAVHLPRFRERVVSPHFDAEEREGIAAAATRANEEERTVSGTSVAGGASG